MAPISAEDLILEILRDADGEWLGRTRLNKAFYFAHLYYAIERPGLLTDWPIVRMPQGPGIDKGDELLAKLVREGYMTVEHFHDGPFPENRYRLTDKARPSRGLPGDAKSAIEKATIFCQNKTAAELSQITHENSRSWNQAKDGDILDIHIDTISDDEYERRKVEVARLDKIMSTVLGDR
jgi:hypothetical protein